MNRNPYTALPVGISRISFLLFRGLSCLSLLCMSCLPARGQDVESSSSLSLWGMIEQGGWAMYPLGFCSFVMFFLIFHSWRESHRRRFVPASPVEEVYEMFGEGRMEDGIAWLRGRPSVLSRAMEKSLQRIRPEVPDLNRAKAEATLVEYLEAEESSVSQWINYLNVVGSVSPMIGLLGTVSGMISAFQTIGQGGMGRPELLAGDIGEALITTAAGLVVGIPAMIAFFVLRNRLAASVVATSQIASDLLDALPSGDPWVGCEGAESEVPANEGR